MAEALQQQRVCLQIHPDDNVLVALKNLGSGTLVSIGDHEFILPQDVAAKHKIFVRNMKPDDNH
jgi:altronate hydrolase